MHGHTHRLPELRVRRDWYEGLEEVTLQVKMTHYALNVMHFVSKIMNFVFKMMHFL